MRARLHLSCPAPVRLAALLAFTVSAGCASTQAARIPPAPAACSLAAGRSRVMMVSPVGEVGKKVIPLSCAGKPYAELELYLGDEKHCRSLAVRYVANDERVWLVHAKRLDPAAPIAWEPISELESSSFHVYDVKAAGDGRTITYRDRDDDEAFDVLEGKKL